MPTLVRRGNGNYHAVFCYQGKRVWRSTYTKDREEALRMTAELQKEFPNWRNVTTLKFREQLLPVLEGQVAPATIEAYDISLRRFAEVVGNKFLRAITPYDIELFKSTRLKEVRPATVSMYFRTLKVSFNRACAFGIIKNNPFSKVKNVRLPDEEPAFLSQTDLARVLQCTGDTQLKAIIVIGICSAMRLGEIVNLKWESVDLERGFIHLVNRPDFVLKGKRRRSVPLNMTASRILAGLERRSDYVFSDGRGRKLRGEFVSKNFKKCARKAGLSERIHFHSLRHSGASLLVQMSVPLPFVQRILGHSNIQTTSLYTHETSQHLKESVEKLDGLFEESNN
ncbi:MAG: tyrosine-type recombinase/integrase [Bacteroidota bacterium]